MEAVKKYWIWGIFISILSIFAMSHNASALTSTFNINNYEIVRSDYRLSINCVGNFNTILNSYTCNIPYVSSGLTNITNIYTNQINAKAGDIIEYYLVFSNSLNNSIDGGALSFNIYQPQNAANIQTLSIENVDTNTFLEIGSSYTQNPEFFNSIDGFTVFNKNKVSKVYKITQRVINDGNHRFGLAGSSDLPLLSFYNVSGNSVITANLALFTQYRFIGDEANKEQQEKTQEAVDDSQAAGGSSSSDAQTGTTGLLNAITGAVSVISSASPTNCKINGNMGNLDIGQLDLCANPAPAFIQTIGSLILILMCVPLAISLFNRFIAIFRSFQS